MVTLLKKRWVQMALGLILMVILGIAAGLYATRDTEPPERPDRVVIHAGGGLLEQTLPLTAQAAIAEGWTDPQQCFSPESGHPKLLGRYFVSEPADPNRPYLLVYNADDALLGTYFFFETEMPSPWQHEPTGLEGAANMAFEHWGLHIYVRDKTAACQATTPG